MSTENDIFVAARREAHQALSLIVTQRRNALRKLLYAELHSRPSVWTEVSSFRTRPVCLAIGWKQLEDGCLRYLVRGFVPPFYLLNACWYLGFVKRPDNSWGNALWDEEARFIRGAIERATILW